MAKNAKSVPVLTVKIFSPTETYYSGEAESVSALNETGAFDILPMHHNFISLLLPGDISVKTLDGRTLVYPVRQSLLHTTEDTVTIFIDV